MLNRGKGEGGADGREEGREGGREREGGERNRIGRGRDEEIISH